MKSVTEDLSKEHVRDGKICQIWKNMCIKISTGTGTAIRYLFDQKQVVKRWGKHIIGRKVVSIYARVH